MIIEGTTLIKKGNEFFIDRNNDGKIDDDEMRLKDSGIQIPQQQTETGETIDKMNDTGLVGSSGLSKMSVNSNVDRYELPLMKAYSGIIAEEFLSKEDMALLNACLMLNNSLERAGRKDIVNLATGLKEQKAGGGFMNKFAGMFRKGETQ